MSVVRTLGLSKSFGTGKDRVEVLRDIKVEIGAGEFVAIVGRSGSGKSTLLYCMSGLLRPDSGSVVTAGAEISRLSGDALAKVRRDHVGFVFQDLNLISSLTVADNVRLPASLVGKKLTSSQVKEALAAVDLTDKARKFPDALSGGQRQRVAIARALARQPRILFADEPTGSLDVETGRHVMELLLRTKSPHSAQVMVTHDLDLAAMADRVIVLDSGRISTVLAAPTASEIFDALHARIR